MTKLIKLNRPLGAVSLGDLWYSHDKMNHGIMTIQCERQLRNVLTYPLLTVCRNVIETSLLESLEDEQ